MTSILDKIRAGIGWGKTPTYDFDLEAGIAALQYHPHISNEDWAVLAKLPVSGSGQSDPSVVADRRALALRESHRRAKPPPPDRPEGAPANPQPLQVPTSGTVAQPLPAATGPLFEMTLEQLQARRRATLASISFDLPFHRRVLNKMKNAWRIIGPFAFVLFTSWEVYYFIHSFMPKDESWTSSVLLWGITLLIEVPFMVATYDMAERKAVAAEKRARGEPTSDRDSLGAVVLWIFLALVNVAGQVAFLVLVTRVGANPFSDDRRTLGLWFFILVRVSGVIAGDAYTAFFLRPDETTVERVLRAQKAQMEGEKALAESDAERMRTEAEADATIRRIKVSVERDEREARFIADWQMLNMRQTLARQERFMLAEEALSKVQVQEVKETDSGDL